MASNGLFVVVDPPPISAPRGSTIVRSANLVPNTVPAVVDGVGNGGGGPRTGLNWTAGLRWRPAICGSSQRDKAILTCGSTGFTVFGTLSPSANVDYVPPSVAVGVPCSAISGEAELQHVKDRARDLLDRCATLGIGRELWRGDVAQGETPVLPNHYLGMNGTVTQLNGGASTAAVEALAWLEDAIASTSCGGPGMIHCTPYTATIWAYDHLIERQPDGRILTVLGTIVVADPGYDGSSPTQAVDATKATMWAYGTGMVDLRLGDVMVLPPGDTLVSGVNRTNNDFNVYAYRPFAATFDPCTHVGIKVNHSSRV